MGKLFNLIGGLKAHAAVILVTAAIAGAGGLYVGAAVSKAHYEGIQLKQALAYAKAWQGEVQALGDRVRVESDRAARAAEVRRDQSETAAGVIHEAANDPDARDCEWRDAQRLRVDKSYQTYGYSTGGPSP